jgi:hypothetical protein
VQRGIRSPTAAFKLACISYMYGKYLATFLYAAGNIYDFQQLHHTITDFGAAVALCKCLYVWSLGNANLYEMKVLPGASDVRLFIFPRLAFFAFSSTST